MRNPSAALMTRGCLTKVACCLSRRSCSWTPHSWECGMAKLVLAVPVSMGVVLHGQSVTYVLRAMPCNLLAHQIGGAGRSLSQLVVRSPCVGATFACSLGDHGDLKIGRGSSRSVTYKTLQRRGKVVLKT